MPAAALHPGPPQPQAPSPGRSRAPAQACTCGQSRRAALPKRLNPGLRVRVRRAPLLCAPRLPLPRRPSPCRLRRRGGEGRGAAARAGAGVGSWRVSSKVQPQASPQARRLSRGWKGRILPLAPGPLPRSPPSLLAPQLAQPREDPRAPKSLPQPPLLRPLWPQDARSSVLRRLPSAGRELSVPAGQGAHRWPPTGHPGRSATTSH